jgi:hypothetical protein
VGSDVSVFGEDNVVGGVVGLAIGVPSIDNRSNGIGIHCCTHDDDE